MSEEQGRFMREAIRLAEASVREGGGPFGAVVVKDGHIIGSGSNRVALDNDPSAHAEVVAIRAACRALGNFSLAGCTLYVNCEPCPMCFAAAFWARIDRICFAASAADAAAAGFDDERIARQGCLPWDERQMETTRMMREEALAAFAAWRAKPDRIDY